MTLREHYHTPEFWLDAVLLALVMSVLGNYVTRFLDRTTGRMTNWWHITSRRRQAAHEAAVAERIRQLGTMGGSIRAMLDYEVGAARRDGIAHGRMLLAGITMWEVAESYNWHVAALVLLLLTYLFSYAMSFVEDRRLKLLDEAGAAIHAREQAAETETP